MKCSKCDNEPVGFVVIKHCRKTGYYEVYEFRCKEHLLDEYEEQ